MNAYPLVGDGEEVMQVRRVDEGSTPPRAEPEERTHEAASLEATTLALDWPHYLEGFWTSDQIGLRFTEDAELQVRSSQLDAIPTSSRGSYSWSVDGTDLLIAFQPQRGPVQGWRLSTFSADSMTLVVGYERVVLSRQGRPCSPPE